jgi:uncharacterized protein (DUF2147 family)
VYHINGNKAERIEAITFAELGMQENDIEEILRCSIDMMLTWGVVKEGDIIVAKGREDEAILLANGNVIVDGKEKSMQEWLKEIYGWASFQTYAFAIHKESGKTFSQIREEYMEQEKEEV